MPRAAACTAAKAAGQRPSPWIEPCRVGTTRTRSTPTRSLDSNRLLTHDLAEAEAADKGAAERIATSGGMTTSRPQTL